MSDVHHAHETIRRWFDRALPVVDPARAVTGAMSFDGSTLRVGSDELAIDPQGRLIVLAIGKAASSMAGGARSVFGSRIDQGIILTKTGHLGPPVEGFAAFEAGHPVPDERGMAATRTILDAVDGLTDRDCVIALISGGGSALLELPRDGISLEQMQSVTRQLMYAGAGIHDLNTVRKALSLVKGGGLRERIGAARVVSVLLSDVLGNDPSVIASGPTVLSVSTREDAIAVLKRFGLSETLDSAIHAALAPHNTVPLQPVDTSRDVVAVVADNALLVREIARFASEESYRVEIDPAPYDGDAGALGRAMVNRVLDAPDDVDVLIRGGEATVAVTGDGIGGRNTEMALTAALALSPGDPWVVASLASDGDDGNSGAAGAIADPGTARRAREAGVDPLDALARNDSASVFRAAHGLVVTGPSGTNVNDVYIALRTTPEEPEERQ